MIRRLLAVTLMLASTFAMSGCGNATTASDRAAADQIDSSPIPTKCELRIELPVAIQNETNGYAKVQIKNVGKSNVTLVMPGDGSNCRWRTPIVGWSLLPVDSKQQHPKEPPLRCDPRCGNINPLKPNEVFTLKPGDESDLTEWTSFPHDLSPGKYRVVFYYSNVPDLEWTGIPLDKHDEDAMRRLQSSTSIGLVSNEVQLEVTE